MRFARGVQTLGDQNVGIVGHGRGQDLVGLRTGLGSLGALFGHPGVGLLDVQGVDPILGGFVVIHQRHNHIDDLDLAADLGPHLLGHLIAQRLDVGAVRVLRGRRIEIGEHLIKGGPPLPGHEVVKNVFEVAVVQEQFIGGRRLDAPPHAVSTNAVELFPGLTVVAASPVWLSI